jgi:tetratricopeptide (TPR) repeat protein/TolB-like protein
MATVYLAEDLRHHRPVALKVLNLEVAATVGPERFLREIETAANLTHPHILPLFDSGEADGFLFYVMPFVKGESLRTRLTKEKQLPVEDAVRITREIADALAYAHEEGGIHRDVKPANIMLEAGHAVLADFGVAHAVAEAKEERLTRTGTSLGTPAYMSPEQAAGERELDGRADQYALGCVLYEILAGHPPFSGIRVEAVIRQHLTSEPPSVTQARPSVTDEMTKVINRALAKSPADRFRTTREMAEALAITAVPVRRISASSSTPVRLALAASAMVAVSAAVLWALKPDDTGLQDPSRTVAVLPLHNETGNAALDYLANMAASVITEGLGRVELSRVVAFNDIYNAAQAAPDVAGSSSLRRNWAEETGANLAVVGGYYPLGDSLQFRLQIIDRNREVLANVQPVVGAVTNPDAALQALQMEACSSVAELVAPGDKRRRSLQGVHIPTPEAHQVYLDALKTFHRGRWVDAETELERASSLDPDYFPPLMQLVGAKINLGKPVEADSICRLIERRYDELSREQQLKNDQRCAMARGDRWTALQRSRQLLEFRPNEVYHLGLHANFLNRPDEAIRALTRYDPHLSGLDWDWYDRVLWQLAWSQHLLRDHEEELAITREGRRDFPESVRLVGNEVHALAALGRVDELETAMEEWLSLRPPAASPYPVFSRAAEELEAHGSPDAAKEIWERAIHWYELNGISLVTASGPERWNLGRALLALERLDEARSLEELAADDPDDLEGQLYLGVLRAKLGDRTGAERVAQRLAEWNQPLLKGEHTYYRAAILANLGELDAAVHLLEEVVAGGYSNTMFMHRNPLLRPLWGHPSFRDFLNPRG